MAHLFGDRQLAMLSGKGGVGKTTLSCGLARQWARQRPDETVLLISTDPAHSLGDVLGVTVGDAPTPLPDVANLQVRALNAEALLQTFKAKYGSVLELLVERGSFVEGNDLTPVWDMNWPGLDELMGVLEIQRLLRQQEADRVVVDMAPSGHTLNLFGLMDFLDQFLASLELFQEKHRYMVKALSGRYSNDNADDFLAEMKGDLTAGRALLQDCDRTACWVIAIAEPLSLQESQRFVASLGELKIPVGGVVVNHLVTAAENPARHQAQQTILHRFQPLESAQWGVPRQATEPVGGAALDHLANQLYPLRPDELGAAAVAEFQWPQPIPPGFSDLVAEGRRLVLVGGKGGVGKTTVSAALAWGLAERHPDRSIRVMSIDPAHSLGDAFEQGLGHDPTPLAENLLAQEVSAERVLADFRDEYLWELAEMMAGDLGEGSLEIAYGPEAWRQIVSQALPGIDEMLSLITVMDLLEQDDAALIVLDTAPTGHLLRFLEMPDALGDWLAWIFKLWIKYQDVAGHTELIGRLRTLRQRVVKAQKRLKDPAHTEFVGVLQNQSAILAEAQRLSQQLDTMGISQRHLVHNRYQGQDLGADLFAGQTIVRLPDLPFQAPPFEQVKGAAQLLFGDG